MAAAQRPRLLLLIPHLGGGGAERVTALLARGLSPAKYDVHLGLVTQSGMVTPVKLIPHENGDIEACEVRVHALGARRVRGGAVRLLRLIRWLKPDVILSGMAHLNFLVLLLRPLFPRGNVCADSAEQHGVGGVGFWRASGLYAGTISAALWPRGPRDLPDRGYGAGSVDGVWRTAGTYCGAGQSDRHFGDSRTGERVGCPGELARSGIERAASVGRGKALARERI